MKHNKEIQSDEIILRDKLIYKFVVGVAIVVVFQIIVFAFVYTQWGAAKLEKQQSYQKLQSTVTHREKFIEQYFENEQAILSHYQEHISASIEELANKIQSETGESPFGERLFTLEAVENASDFVMNLLYQSNADGAFITFSADESSEFHQGVYFRLNDDKVQMLIGTKQIAEKYNIEVDDDIRETFRVTQSVRCDYYNRIEQAVMDGSITTDAVSGYLSPKFKLHGDNKEIITYTVPLLSQDGQMYGVAGLELSIKKIMDSMPYTELGSGSDNMYYLAYRSESTGKVVKELLSSNTGFDISDADGMLDYTNTNSSSVLEMKDRKKGKYVACLEKLDFENEKLILNDGQWMILGVVNENTLYSQYRLNIIYTTIVFAVIVIIASVVYGYYVMKLSRKMNFMISQINNITPRDEWNLNKTGVGEFDKLGELCKNLFEKSLSSTKLAETINLVNMPIGAIEYDENEPYVFCMDKAAEILEFHNINKDSLYMKKEHFLAEGNVLKKNLDIYDEETDTYHMIGKDRQHKYIRIKVLDNVEKTHIAVMDVTDEINKRMKIEYERDHDILTHLLNRMAFKRSTAKIIEKGDTGVAAILMLDLDNLKYFNDTYGHDYGDKYIVAAANVLTTIASDKVLVARMSGDEFLVFFHGFDERDEIRQIIRETHLHLKESFVKVPSGECVKLRASAGIAWYPDDADSLEELIRFADFAMYESKHNMKGTIKEFDDDNFKKNKVLFQGSEELNKLIENPDKVKYAFHPIIDARTGEIFAYEALMRPQIEVLKSPEDVMRLATAQSRLYDIEYMTWNEALKAVYRQKKGGDEFKIFINSVPNHELRSKDLNKLVDKFGSILNRVVIEIIENEQADKHCMESKFRWAEKYGMSIALDDFGTGYSNEGTLLFINPKFVKIDMSMVFGVHNDDNKRNLIQNLLSYTQPRGIKVIAEGIENFEDMDTLIELGVDYLQGWYFTKPQYEIKDIADEFKCQIRKCYEKWS